MKPFASLTGKEALVELLRWLAVPVVAIGWVLLWVVLVRLVFPPAMAQPPGTPAVPVPAFQRYVLSRAIAVVMAAGFVVAGAKMAPRFRSATSIVLAAAWLARAFLYDVFVHLGRGTPHYLDFTLAVIAVAAGVAYVISVRTPHQTAGADQPQG